MKKINLIIILLLALSIYSCDRFSLAGFIPFGNSTVNQRFDESMKLPTPIPEININDSCYRIYCSGDIHYAGSADNFKKMIEIQEKDNSAKLSIILGDITDMKGGLPQFKDSINNINISTPIAYTIGNHDLFFNQWNDYKNNFGSTVYSFTITSKNFSDLFICLDSGNGTFGSKQKKWLEKTLDANKNKHRYSFIFTHTNIWNKDNSQTPSGNRPIEESLYISHICELYNIDMVIMGHDHTREITTFKGTDFITLDAIKDKASNASYLTIDCSQNSITHKFNPIP